MAFAEGRHGQLADRRVRLVHGKPLASRVAGEWVIRRAYATARPRRLSLRRSAERRTASRSESRRQKSGVLDLHPPAVVLGDRGSSGSRHDALEAELADRGNEAPAQLPIRLQGREIGDAKGQPGSDGLSPAAWLRCVLAPLSAVSDVGFAGRQLVACAADKPCAAAFTARWNVTDTRQQAVSRKGSLRPVRPAI